MGRKPETERFDEPPAAMRPRDAVWIHALKRPGKFGIDDVADNVGNSREVARQVLDVMHWAGFLERDTHGQGRKYQYWNPDNTGDTNE